MSRLGLEPMTYGLSGFGRTLVSAHTRSFLGFDARGRPLALLLCLLLLWGFGSGPVSSSRQTSA